MPPLQGFAWTQGTEAHVWLKHALAEASAHQSLGESWLARRSECSSADEFMVATAPWCFGTLAF